MYKYQEISNTLQQEIEHGIYQKGNRLPSVRELRKQYHCNQDTILRALQHLKEKNYIYPVEKSGYYVLKDHSKKLLSQKDFRSVSIEFPMEDFRRCLNESLWSVEDLIGHSTRGNPDLLQAVQPLFESYGVYATVDRMVVTTGTQQALYILLQLIGDQGLLLEQPTYDRMNELVDHLSIPYETINRTIEGDQIDLQQLEEWFQSGKVKFFYTISRFHNPLGVSYSDRVKKRIVELAALYGVYIIEDDYMADYVEGPATPLHYFDTQERVIYVKSFSSLLYPSFKMGIVVLPSTLVEDFSTRRRLLDYDSNSLLQKTLALYIENGMFEKHRQKTVGQYHERAKQLQQLIEQYHTSSVHLYGTTLILPETLAKDVEGTRSLEKQYLSSPKGPSYVTMDVSVMDMDVFQGVLQTIKEVEMRE